METDNEKTFNGLTTVNVEITSRCQKRCWMCGRRKIERDFPHLVDWGDMPFELVEKIAKQLPSGIVVQFHNNGESLLYPRFGEAVKFFDKQIKCLDTNGKLLVEKTDEIIDNLDTLTISVIQGDIDGFEQYEIVKKFLGIKGNRKPLMIYRLLGDVHKPEKWKELPGIVCTRTLHNPMGGFKYKKTPTIPEIGICLDLLNHFVIDRFGKVSCCVRFDPNGLGIIGNIKNENLISIWNSERRRTIIRYHLEGQRSKVPLCNSCEFYGVPVGI